MSTVWNFGAATEPLRAPIYFEMHEKGLRHDKEFPDLVDDLEKAASEGKLPVIMEAVKMAAPNMGNHFSINNDEAAGIGMSDFEAYLVGNVG